MALSKDVFSLGVEGFYMYLYMYMYMYLYIFQGVSLKKFSDTHDHFLVGGS